MKQRRSILDPAGRAELRRLVADEPYAGAMSDIALARALGISRPDASRWRRGMQLPSPARRREAAVARFVAEEPAPGQRSDQWMADRLHLTRNAIQAIRHRLQIPAPADRARFAAGTAEVRFVRNSTSGTVRCACGHTDGPLRFDVARRHAAEHATRCAYECVVVEERVHAVVVSAARAS